MSDLTPLVDTRSDGPQPHLITLNFHQKVSISQVSLLLNHAIDDSYTPTHISFRAGTSPIDLKEVRVIELEEPNDWIDVFLAAGNDPDPEMQAAWSDGSEDPFVPLLERPESLMNAET